MSASPRISLLTTGAGTQHADGQKLITRLSAVGYQVIWIAPSGTAAIMKDCPRRSLRLC